MSFISYNIYPSLMQLVIVSLFLRLQHVSAVHGLHQASATVLKLLHCTVCHNITLLVMRYSLITKLKIKKIKIGQP
jgi:hypothetical protein